MKSYRLFHRVIIMFTERDKSQAPLPFNRFTKETHFSNNNKQQYVSACRFPFDSKIIHKNEAVINTNTAFHMHFQTTNLISNWHQLHFTIILTSNKRLLFSIKQKNWYKEAWLNQFYSSKAGNTPNKRSIRLALSKIYSRAFV